jgi:hypothetical protein
MTTQQDSVDVERQARELLAAQGDARFAANVLAHGRDERVSVTASTALDAIIAALSLPITQRDEQGDRNKPAEATRLPREVAYAFCGKLRVSEKADVAKELGIVLDYQLPSLARDKAFLRAVVDTGKVNDLATAIRRLSIEQGDKDGGAE